MLKISSQPGNVSKIESFVRSLFQDNNIQEDLFPNILISLTEAVNNAIIHGNNNDASKFVSVVSDIRSQRLCLRISDEGHGFNPSKIPDPTTEDNVCRLGGRGVFLIRELSDQVRFHNNGSTVEIEFKL